MITEEMLRVNRVFTLEVIFQVMRVVVYYRKGQKQLKEIAPHLKSTLARPPIYDQTYPEVLSTASPGNPLGVTKPNSHLLFAQSDKSIYEVSIKVKKLLSWQFPAKNPPQKLARSRNLHQNSLLYTLLKRFLNSSDMHHLAACWTR